MQSLVKKYQMAMFTVLLTSGLVACGGGSDGGSDNTDDLPENLPEAISPELSEDFIPFENTDLLTSLKDLFNGTVSGSTNYNRALGHMIGEVFADYPIARTGRLVQLYNMGDKIFTWKNITCSSLTESTDSQTLTVNKNCVMLDKTFKSGSQITKTVTGDTTTITFTGVRYGSNVDFSLKDEYLVSGSIQKIVQQIGSIKIEQYKIGNLTYQRVVENGNGGEGETFSTNSKEYLQAKNYDYQLKTEDNVRTLTTNGTIIGQPLNATFRYKFTYQTDVLNPFKMNKLGLIYHHLPNAGGVLNIEDQYNVDNTIIVKQLTDQSLNASIEFKGEKVGDLLWSTIIGSKN
ncbi:hypothetical protein [Acinetobacter shaoyimingii]|uniref:Lipoprotein n=1 Tax=Acinetobacter shaoyimingii TaxID=2715164 RepID=A0A6G8RTF8_9GAMM|nr:hypothetical protein [Acinetobacter shaoyimingii]QIO05157.1 hypothetical protein G8E00_03850 [Acinetobacter shaoyimingii]